VNDPHAKPDAANRSLDNIQILMEAPREIVDEVISLCTWAEFQENDVVVDSDDASTDVFFVVKGRLRAMDYLTENQQVALADLEAGESFGELSAIDLKMRSARVVALEHSVLASMSSRDFRKLLMDCPGIALALLKRFASFIRTLNTRVTAMSTMSPHQRIYFELLRLAEPDTGDPGGWIINNAPNHAEIASWVGADRQTVADAIGNLARDGVIERKHKNLRIRDHSRLQRLVNQQ